MDAQKTIKTNCYGITVTLKDGGGTISSNMKDGEDDKESPFSYAIDGIEATILAHAVAGIDITSPAYLEGIKTAVEGICNNLN